MRIHALLFFLFSESALALYGARPTATNAHLVKLKVNGEVFCQAVALSPTKVLTAGHCIEQMGLRIRINPHLLTYYPEHVSVIAGKESVSAKAITFAPSMFDSPDLLSEDLALVELSAPLKSAVFLPVAAKTDLVPGSSLFLTSGNEEAQVPFRKRVSGPDSLVIMTDGSTAGVCQGDSGGGLILVKNGRKFLAGILAARSEGCQRKHSVSYFPRLKFNF